MYIDGKWVTDKFKPRRYTQDRMSNTKLVKVRKHREFLEKANRLHSNDSYNLALAMFEHRDLYLSREELSRLTGIDVEGIKSRIGTLRNNGFLFDNASPSTKVPGRWKMIGIKDVAKPEVPKQENNKFCNLLNSVFGMGELNYEG